MEEGDELGETLPEGETMEVEAEPITDEDPL